MKLFVWDFHGVLEKGNDHAVVEITNMALEQHGYDRRMTVEESEYLAGLRWNEYFAYLLPEASPEECKKLQAVSVELSHNCPEIIAKHIKLNDHADYVLDSISSRKFTQILISNTQPKSLDLFVQFVGIEKYFPPSHRFAVDNHAHKHSSKLDYLEGFLQDKHFPAGIVSIGDSPHDMAMIHNHPKGIGYLYAHPGRTHRKVESHYKISDLRHVLQEIESH